MLEVTGERLLPEQQRGELVHAQHLARYRFAAQFARGRRVLDAACGEGYGTAILAAAGARAAVGVDIDQPTVDHARAKYGLDFERADVAELPFEDGSFDLGGLLRDARARAGRGPRDRRVPARARPTAAC